MEAKETRVKYSDLENFHSHLGILVEAELPLPDGLRQFAREVRNPKFGQAVRQIADKLDKGKSLSEAMKAEDRFFAPEYVAIIRTGEKGGNLLAALELAFEHELFQKDFRDRLRGYLIYPALVFVVIGITYSVLISIAYPEFIEIYTIYGSSLPWPTRTVLGAFDFAGNYGLFILLSLMAAVIIFRYGAARKLMHSLWLKIPLLKNILIERFITSFSEGLSILLRAEVPLPESLRLMAEITPNIVFKRAIMNAAARSEQGGRLDEALESQGIFPGIYIAALRLGEEGIILPDSLAGIAKLYRSETIFHAGAFLRAIDIILILALGAWTTVLLTALYSMYWRLVLVIDYTKLW